MSACSVLMLDEAHERTLNTDIAVGLLKKVGVDKTTCSLYHVLL